MITLSRELPQCLQAECPQAARNSLSIMLLMSHSDLVLAAMLLSDWPDVRAIYAEGIRTGNAAFETETPDWEKWNAGHLECCRLVARKGKETLGWAALSRVSTRAVYAGVAEVSVYIGERARGQRVGFRLLQALVEESERVGIWTLQASIFAENVVSIHLHERRGFRIVGRREKIGCLHGVWRDTVLMERRSTVAGK
jgi:L-amino acid N-acyltransferase YncA